MSSTSAKPIPYCEVPRETLCGHIIASDIHRATKAEIKKAKDLHAKGKCPHNIVWDEPGWMYDYRSCYTCGAGLGAI